MKLNEGSPVIDSIEKQPFIKPEDLKIRIEAEWSKINFGAEITGIPYFIPFDESDISGRPKPEASKYLTKSPKVAAEILGFSLEENFANQRIAIIGAGKSSLGAKLKEKGAFCVDIDPNFKPKGLVKPTHGSTPIIA